MQSQTVRESLRSRKKGQEQEGQKREGKGYNKRTADEQFQQPAASR
jgi:hypothetical protein